jgi:hypothetical protein
MMPLYNNRSKGEARCTGPKNLGTNLTQPKFNIQVRLLQPEFRDRFAQTINRPKLLAASASQATSIKSE